LSKKIALISTGAELAVKLKKMTKEFVPEAEIISIVDDSVVPTISREAKGLPKHIIRRICNYAVYAEKSGAEVILVTCSSINKTVDFANGLVDVPVLKIDEPMMEEAIEKGESIGVIATLSTTLNPTTELLKSKIDETGKNIKIISEIVEGAFESLSEGQGDVHDKLVRKKIKDLEEKVDCIILAQASMARATDGFDSKITVLTSIPGGLKVACDLLQEITTEGNVNE
jgi:aspartate/glutamate racemase